MTDLVAFITAAFSFDGGVFIPGPGGVTAGLLAAMMSAVVDLQTVTTNSNSFYSALPSGVQYTRVAVLNTVGLTQGDAVTAWNQVRGCGTGTAWLQYFSQTTQAP